MNPISSYFLKIRAILLHPALFFREMPHLGGVSGPLGFALTSHWMGAALSYLWRAAFSPLRLVSMQDLFERYGTSPSIDLPGRNSLWSQFGPLVTEWFFGMASVITDPFITLVSILSSALFIFIGARLLVPAGQNGVLNEVSYESAVRILCYSMAPALLAGVPIFGSGVAWVYTWVVLVIGVKEVYRVSTGHAILITLFPKLLILGIIGGGLLLLSLLFFQFVVTGW
jgi:hypothetical protein